MFLSGLFVENFRTFGSEASGKHLDVMFRPGLNVLAGENDSGKTAVIDAIRHLLWTTSLDYHRLTDDDFHVSQKGRAPSLRISGKFSCLSSANAAQFLEWVSIDECGNPVLYITLNALRLETSQAGAGTHKRVAVTVRSGKNGDGPSIDGEIREFLRVTYLRPLRDAEAELAAGKGSRLSQILQSHPSFQNEHIDDFDPLDPNSKPQTLVGIMRHAEDQIARNAVIAGTKKQLNEEYLQHVSIGDEVLTGSIGVARSTELRQILEKLELRIDPPASLELRTPRGLGFNNVLFMATELLLLGKNGVGALPLLLIEEPEAHIHPQKQLRLMTFLDGKCRSKDSPIQVLLTTHSPNLASQVDLECVILMHKGCAFSLSSEVTTLEKGDYRFLQRFLDVTKANLFFAKGVLIVEGDAEHILLPVIAEILDRSFSKYGVSIVNVGSRGLFRYARIFQRRDKKEMPIRVACLADRDLPPASATSYVQKRTNRAGELCPTYDSEFAEDAIKERIRSLESRNGDGAKTFVSPSWTLEYDLALGEMAEHVHVAIQISRLLKNKTKGVRISDIVRAIRTAKSEINGWRAEGLSIDGVAAKIYEDLYLKRASKAETAQVLSEILRRKVSDTKRLQQMLPTYIINAISFVTGQDGPGDTVDAEQA
jgi:putative ATP-dependent endonuclease of OLD family